MRKTKITASAGKRISREVQKGLWRAWEVGFSVEAELEIDEDWEHAMTTLDAELKAFASKALPSNTGTTNTDTGGGGSNQVSNRGKPFGFNANLADQYQ